MPSAYPSFMTPRIPGTTPIALSATNVLGHVDSIEEAMMYPAKFSVGEIAIAIDPRGPFDGLECQIVKGLHQATGLTITNDSASRQWDRGRMYGVQFQGTRMLLAFPWELRKRPAPPERVDTQELASAAT